MNNMLKKYFDGFIKSTKKSIRFSKYNVKEKNQLFYLKLVKKFYDKYKVNNYYPHFDTPIYLAFIWVRQSIVI